MSNDVDVGHSNCEAEDDRRDDDNMQEAEEETVDDVGSQPQPTTPEPVVTPVTMPELDNGPDDKAVTVDRKPEDEIFVLVDDDLDNDIISIHASSFQRSDPFAEETPGGVAASQTQPRMPSPVSKPSVTEAAPKENHEEPSASQPAQSAGETVNSVVESSPAGKPKISEKPAAKRLVCMLERQATICSRSPAMSG